MIITIEPDYELFIKLLLFLYVTRGIVQIILGLKKSKIERKDNHGITTVLAGLLTVIISVWIIF